MSPGSSIVVVDLAQASPEEDLWQSFIEAHPDATIYHDLAWRRIFGKSLGYRSHYLMAREAGGAVRGVLPLFRVPSLLGRPRLVSVPFRDRGGILAADEAAFAILTAEAGRLRDASGADFVEIKSLNPYPSVLVEAAGLTRRDHWMHSQVDLSSLSTDTLDRALRDKMRAIRQGIAAGLSLDDCTAAPDAAARWQSIYARSQQALGLPAFPIAFFAGMIGELGPRGLLRVMITKDGEGNDLSGMIVFKDRRRSIYAYSASVPGEKSVRPNDFMLYQLYKLLLGEGQEIFDFGADSPGQEGLLRFKRKWLAKQSPIPFYYLGTADPSMSDSSGARFDQIRAVVRRMPVALSRLLLSPMVRYFG